MDDFDPYEFYEPDEDKLEVPYAVDSYFYAAQEELELLFAENPRKVYPFFYAPAKQIHQKGD